MAKVATARADYERRVAEKDLRRRVAREESVQLPPTLRLLSPLPRALERFAAASDAKSGTLYVMGGRERSTDGKGVVCSDTWICDAKNRGAWLRLEAKSLFPPRYGARAALVGRHVVMFGGVGADDRMLGDVWSLDTAEPGRGWSEIRTKGSTPTPCHGCVWQAMDQDSIWLYGGAITKQGEPCDQLFRLSLTEEQQSDEKQTPVPPRLLHGVWTVHKSPGAPASRFNAAYASVGPHMYVFGGKTSKGVVSDIWRLDTERQRWACVSVDSGARSGGRQSALMAATGNSLVLFGGVGPAAQPVKSILRLDFSARRVLDYKTSLPLATNPHPVNRTTATATAAPGRGSPSRVKAVFSAIGNFIRTGARAAADLVVGGSQDGLASQRKTLCAVWQSLPLSARTQARCQRFDSHSNLLHLDGHLMVVGGLPASVSRPLLSLARFRGATNSLWGAAKPIYGRVGSQTLAPHPFALQGPAACTYGKRIFVFGGKHASTAQPSNQLFVYEPSLNRWFCVDTRSAVPPPTYGGAMVAIADHLIAFGGQTFGEIRLNQVWVFSMRTCAWKCLKTQGAQPSRRCGAAAGVGPVSRSAVDSGGKTSKDAVLPFALWVFGGDDGKYKNDLFELQLCWDAKERTISKGQWILHRPPKPPAPRCFSSAVSFPDISQDAQAAPLAVEEVTPRWDTNVLPTGASVSIDGRTISSSPRSSEGGASSARVKAWRTVACTSTWRKNTGTHRLSIRIDAIDVKINTYGLCFGLLSQRTDPRTLQIPLGWDNVPGCALILGTGQKLSRSDVSRYAPTGLSAGDRVTIEYNTRRGAVRFACNGRWGQEMTVGLEEDFRPALSLATGSQSVTILPADPASVLAAPVCPPFRLLVWGGRTASGGDDACADSGLHCLEISSKPRWVQIESAGRVPAGRYKHAMGVIGRHLYIVGGADAKSHPQGQVFIAEISRDVGETLKAVDISQPNCQKVMGPCATAEEGAHVPPEPLPNRRDYKVGTRVVRGPTWKWGDQDGGSGCFGSVTVLEAKGWLTVQWDEGESNSYRVDDENNYYDVVPLTPADKRNAHALGRPDGFDQASVRRDAMQLVLPSGTVVARTVWMRKAKEVKVEVINSSVRHISVVLRWTSLSNCRIKLVGKGALVVPPKATKTYAVFSVSDPTQGVSVEFSHVVDPAVQGGPSFYVLQPPHDAVPKPTVMRIEGGLMASRRRVEIRGVQVDTKHWQVCLKRGQGKYHYLEILVQPQRQRIVRRIKSPVVSGEETKGGCPIGPGSRFVLEIRVDTKAFEIFINRVHFATYAHRLPFENIDTVEVSGDVCVTSCRMVDGPWIECSSDCYHCRAMAVAEPARTAHRLRELQATRRAMQEEAALDSVVGSMALVSRQTSMMQRHAEIREYKSEVDLRDVVAQPELLAPIVYQCLASNQQFADITFPAGEESIGGKDKHVKRWRRAREVAGDNGVLFLEGAASGDVVQGELGDCYFLGALSIVATRYELFRRLFVPTGLGSIGVYTVRFYKDGQWRKVTVDDQIPCGGNGKPCYGRNKSPREFWVVIAEKAYAKLHHSYHNIDGSNGGNIGDALVDLTGGVPEEIRFDEHPDALKSGAIFDKIFEYHQKGYLLGIALVPNNVWRASQGIMENHAYSIIDVRRVNESTRLVQLRNPYAKEDWKGAWSEKSEVWNEHLSLLLGRETKNRDGGLFWMSYFDLIRHFNILFVCKVLNEHDWDSHTFRSVFTCSAGTAGGSDATSRWRENTQFALTVERPDTRVIIAVSQSDARMSFRERAWYQDIGFYVGTAGAHGRRRVVCPPGDVYSEPLSNKRTVSAELTLAPGHYVIIPCTRTPDTEVPYVLKIHTDKKCRVGRMVSRVDWSSSSAVFEVRAAAQAAERKIEWVPMSSVDAKAFCTFHKTREKATRQALWRCRTCNADKDVCDVCKRVCHQGHDLVPGRKEPRWCDCGKGNTKVKCCAMPPKAHWRCRKCSTVNIPARTICKICFGSEKVFVIEKKSATPEPRASVTQDDARAREERSRLWRTPFALELPVLPAAAAGPEGGEDESGCDVKLVFSYAKQPPYNARALACSVFEDVRNEEDSKNVSQKDIKVPPGTDAKGGISKDIQVVGPRLAKYAPSRSKEALISARLRRGKRYVVMPWGEPGHSYRLTVYVCSDGKAVSLKRMPIAPESVDVDEDADMFLCAVEDPDPELVGQLTQLGYNAHRARRVLAETKSSKPSVWLQWLSQHSEDPISDEEAEAATRRQVARAERAEARRRRRARAAAGSKNEVTGVGEDSGGAERATAAGENLAVLSKPQISEARAEKKDPPFLPYVLVYRLEAGGYWLVKRSKEPEPLFVHADRFGGLSWRVFKVKSGATIGSRFLDRTALAALAKNSQREIPALRKALVLRQVREALGVATGGDGDEERCSVATVLAQIEGVRDALASAV